MASKKDMVKKAKKGKLANMKLDTRSLGNVVRVSLGSITRNNLKIYGSYVVEQRAIPEFRDGLKPVHRASLWAMQQLNLTYTGKPKKAARVVGDTIGKYHPHGDGATYDAIVALANYKPRLAIGEGNWGTPVDNAAAYRYTEVKLSPYTQLFLLDKGYLNAIHMADNFDGTEKIPLHFPALLPNMLLMGNPTAPAYGIRAGNPPFQLEGMVKLLLNVYKNDTPVTVKKCLKYLEIDYPYDCHVMSDEDDVKSLIETGKGSIAFCPQIEAVWEHKKKACAKKIIITSYSPGFRGDSVEKLLEKISNLQGVSSTVPSCGENDPHGRAGKYGALYIVEPARGMTEEDFYELAEKIEKILTTKSSFHIGCTIRMPDKVGLKRPNVSQFLNTWIKYRVGLEIKYLAYLMGVAQEKLEKWKLLLWAVDNSDRIIKALPKVLKSKTPDETLAKVLKVDLDFAKRLLDLQLRKLALLERKPITDAIKILNAEIKELKADTKNPKPRIYKHLKETYKTYLVASKKYEAECL